jgi:hypothetical protein
LRRLYRNLNLLNLLYVGLPKMVLDDLCRTRSGKRVRQHVVDRQDQILGFLILFEVGDLESIAFKLAPSQRPAVRLKVVVVCQPRCYVLGFLSTVRVAGKVEFAQPL